MSWFKKEKYTCKDQFSHYLNKIDRNDLKSYIEERIIKQIDWYDKKSNVNQKWYKTWMIISIILSGLIPVLTLMIDGDSTLNYKIAVTGFSSAVTAISSILTLYNFRELWVEYRANCEILKSILHRFFNKSGEFANKTSQDIHNLLINSCEEYMTKEFNRWREIKIEEVSITNQSSIGE